MTLSERVVRIAIGGLVVGGVLGLLDGDVWSLAVLREAVFFAVFLSAVWLIYEGARRLVSHFRRSA